LVTGLLVLLVLALAEKFFVLDAESAVVVAERLVLAV
jgi:hypothetical protein